MTILYVATIPVLLWLTWNLFVVVMALRRVKQRWGLTTAQRVLGYPTLIIGYTLDILLRLTVFAVLFVRPPRLETVSEMLEREAEGAGWRSAQARWWRQQTLADFDPTGGHGDPGRKTGDEKP